MDKLKRLVITTQVFSIPLLLGVVASVVFANTDNSTYERIVHQRPFGDAAILGHALTIEFLVNEIFMVFFFGIAAKEITQSALSGGALNPLSKAVNPLMATLGGVLGPVGVYFLLAFVFYGGGDRFSEVANGWGIPTATDIALAWLVARLVFGKSHPAVTFLLLLAVADDAIGLVIIAVFYPSPDHPVEPVWLLLAVGGMAVAFGMRKLRVPYWPPYIAFGGVMSWMGLLQAGVEPALALVVIVPFLPVFSRYRSLTDHTTSPVTEHEVYSQSPLLQFEHHLKLIVDFGLFFFAFINAGVAFGAINPVTWIVLLSLIVGKTVGISAFSLATRRMGFPLPSGMAAKHVLVAGLIAGLGLTVALFVSAKAFPGPPFDDPAKMGAMLSIFVGVLALVAGRILKVRE